jgi:two-component system alkaline phosphatase synthesis response regulator PhoP
VTAYPRRIAGKEKMDRTMKDNHSDQSPSGLNWLGALLMSREKYDAQPEKPPVILVVDDNLPNLELIQAYLEDVDCQIVSAHDGLEALNLVARKKPDLILLDVMMPKMSGFEVCRRLKSDPQTGDIPIIMVTALNEFGDIERGIDSGTDDFVSKPVNRLELLTRVRTMLKLKHLTDKLQRTIAYLSEVEKSAQSAVSSGPTESQ